MYIYHQYAQPTLQYSFYTPLPFSVSRLSDVAGVGFPKRYRDTYVHIHTYNLK